MNYELANSFNNHARFLIRVITEKHSHDFNIIYAKERLYLAMKYSPIEFVKIVAPLIKRYEAHINSAVQQGEKYDPDINLFPVEEISNYTLSDQGDFSNIISKLYSAWKDMSMEERKVIAGKFEQMLDLYKQMTT